MFKQSAVLKCLDNDGATKKKPSSSHLNGLSCTVVARPTDVYKQKWQKLVAGKQQSIK